jgi:hypothetical protein
LQAVTITRLRGPIISIAIIVLIQFLAKGSFF